MRQPVRNPFSISPFPLRTEPLRMNGNWPTTWAIVIPDHSAREVPFQPIQLPEEPPEKFLRPEENRFLSISFLHFRTKTSPCYLPINAGWHLIPFPEQVTYPKPLPPTTTGWIQFYARNTVNTNPAQRVWIKATYTAPDTLDALSTRSRLIPSVDLGPDRYGCNPNTVNLNAILETGLTYVWRDSLGNQVGTNGRFPFLNRGNIRY
jgi:hypothetical protein